MSEDSHLHMEESPFGLILGTIMAFRGETEENN
jgi:hypothetical protein